MAKFTNQQRKLLVSNKNIKKVTASNIQFTEKFKLKAVKDFESGKTSEEIFLAAEIDIKIFGSEYPRKSIHRWRKILKEKGSKAFSEEARGKNSTGRPKGRRGFKSDAEELEYLRAENDFLKKLHALEELYQKKNGSR